MLGLITWMSTPVCVHVLDAQRRLGHAREQRLRHALGPAAFVPSDDALREQDRS